jgi:hypothetical protein
MKPASAGPRCARSAGTGVRCTGCGAYYRDGAPIGCLASS